MSVMRGYCNAIATVTFLVIEHLVYARILLQAVLIKNA